jgi:hypothetical protein
MITEQRKGKVDQLFFAKKFTFTQSKRAERRHRLYLVGFRKAAFDYLICCGSLLRE